MQPAFIGMGSNIGDRAQYIIEALRCLDKHSHIAVATVSSLYETEPVGLKEQAAFLNAVAAVETSLPPLLLLEYCQQVEKELGRVRDVRWGPRTIDLDILLVGELTLTTERLVLPHPRLTERRFVLVPLAEIAEDLLLCQGKTPRELLAATDDVSEVVLYQQLVWR